MNEPPKICPKCQVPLTQLEGGLAACPTCGFTAAEQNADARAQPSQKFFWLALVAPAAMALLSFLIGGASKDSGTMVGMGALAVGFFASIYCGFWVARRFCNQSVAIVFAGLAMTLILGVVNFFIVCAGCAGNVNFH